MRVTNPRDLPPINLEAEQAVLGAILLNNKALVPLRAFLLPEHFSEPVHGRIYAAVLRLVEAGRLADHVTLRQAFRDDPALADLDGPAYLGRLAQAADSISNAAEYGRVVHELAIKRDLVAAGQRLVDTAGNGALAAEAWAEAKAALERLRPHPGPDESGVIDPASWRGEPAERAWIIDEWVPAREVVLLGGAGGTGKSLLLQQLATSVAARRTFLGLPVREGRAIAAFCEDDTDELRRRQAAIDRHLCIGSDAYRGRLLYLARRGLDSTLATFGPDGSMTLTPYFEELCDRAARWKAKVIGLDTLPHHFAGDENNRSHVTRFVSGCLYRLVEKTGASVLVSAHPSRAGMADGTGLSGSTAWEGSVRARLFFSRPSEGDPNARMLERKKSNYAQADGTLPLVWKDGVIMSVEEKTGEPRPAAGSAFLDLLAQLESQGRYVSDKTTANNFAPAIMSNMNNSLGYTKAELRRAMEALFASGRIRMGQRRDKQRRMQEVIVPVGGNLC